MKNIADKKPFIRIFLLMFYPILMTFIVLLDIGIIVYLWRSFSHGGLKLTLLINFFYHCIYLSVRYNDFKGYVCSQFPDSLFNSPFASRLIIFKIIEIPFLLGSFGFIILSYRWINDIKKEIKTLWRKTKLN